MENTQEYFELIRIYEDYQNQVLILKAWSVTVGLTALLAVIASPISNAHKKLGALIAGLIAIPFWWLETMWKAFQKAYELRLRELESCFIQITESCLMPSIMASWRIGYDNIGFIDFLVLSIKPQVFLPHLILLIAGVSGFVYFSRPSDVDLLTYEGAKNG